MSEMPSGESRPQPESTTHTRLETQSTDEILAWVYAIESFPLTGNFEDDAKNLLGLLGRSSLFPEPTEEAALAGSSLEQRIRYLCHYYEALRLPKNSNYQNPFTLQAAYQDGELSWREFFLEFAHQRLVPAVALGPLIRILEESSDSGVYTTREELLQARDVDRKILTWWQAQPPRRSAEELQEIASLTRLHTVEHRQALSGSLEGIFHDLHILAEETIPDAEESNRTQHAIDQIANRAYGLIDRVVQEGTVIQESAHSLSHSATQAEEERITQQVRAVSHHLKLLEECVLEFDIMYEKNASLACLAEMSQLLDETAVVLENSER